MKVWLTKQDITTIIYAVEHTKYAFGRTNLEPLIIKLERAEESA